MKKILVSLLAIVCFVNVKAQSDDDTSMHATAVAVCDCLSKSNITDSSSAQQMQQAFLTCITSSPDFLTKVMAGGDMDGAEKVATELAMELMKINCPSFMTMAMTMAANGGDELSFGLPSAPQAKAEKTESAEGTVVNVEEKDFLYITLKTTAGRELNFIYYTYVPGSDEWLKNPVAGLKNKNVSLSYINTEVYQPKFKQFMNVKQIKTLAVQ